MSDFYTMVDVDSAQTSGCSDITTGVLDQNRLSWFKMSRLYGYVYYKDIIFLISSWNDSFTIHLCNNNTVEKVTSFYYRITVTILIVVMLRPDSTETKTSDFRYVKCGQCVDFIGDNVNTALLDMPIQPLFHETTGFLKRNKDPFRFQVRFEIDEEKSFCEDVVYVLK